MPKWGFGYDWGFQSSTAKYNELILPTAFTDRWVPPFDLFESSSGQYRTNLDYASLRPDYEKTYWVAPDGNNANPGTEGSPILDLSAAVVKTDAATGLRIILNATSGDFLMPGARGWNNAQPTKNILLEKVGDGRAISIASSTTTAPTWAHHSGHIYATTISAANASSVMDLSLFESDGFNVRQNYVGSEGAMVAGSCFHNGAVLLCWALDSRNLVGDQYMWPCSESNNVRIPSASRTTFLDDLEAVGGAPLLYVGSGAVDPLVVAMNCRFQGSRSTSGGALNDFFAEGPGRFFSYRSGFARAYRDGVNYTGNANGSPNYFENENFFGTGGTTSVNDNASTSHNDSNGIRLNENPKGSVGRTVADVGNGRSINLGVLFGQPSSTATSNECYTTAGTTKAWLAGCRFAAGPNPQVSLINTSEIFYRQMPAPVRAGTGEDTGTLAIWS